MPRRLAAVPVLATLVLAALVLGALAAAPTAVAQDRQPGDDAGDKAFAGVQRDLAAGVRDTKPTGDTDQDFVRMMLPHHQAAVDMAKAELQYGKDPALKSLAQDMVGVRDHEVAMMKAWEDKHPR